MKIKEVFKKNRKQWPPPKTKEEYNERVSIRRQDYATISEKEQRLEDERLGLLNVKVGDLPSLPDLMPGPGQDTQKETGGTATFPAS